MSRRAGLLAAGTVVIAVLGAASTACSPRQVGTLAEREAARRHIAVRAGVDNPSSQSQEGSPDDAATGAPFPVDG